MYCFLFNLPAHWPGDRWVFVSAMSTNFRMAAKKAVREHFKGSDLPHEVEIHIRLHTKRKTSQSKTSRFKVINHDNGDQSIEYVEALKNVKQRRLAGPKLMGGYR